MRDRRVHVQIRQCRLLARDDDVDVVAAAQAVIGHRQQCVGVRRQVHPHHFGPLVGDVVDEAGILMRCAVVVLTPNMGCQKVIQRCDRPPPRQVPTAGQPLGVLVEHRVDDVHERLVAVEQPVPAGEQVALEPALTQMLGEHLHHAALRPEVLVVGPGLGQPRLVGRLEHRRRAGSTRFRRAPSSGTCRGCGRSRREGTSRAPGWLQRFRWPVCPRRRRNRGTQAGRDRAAVARRWHAGWRSSCAARSAPAPATRAGAPPARRTVPRAGSCAATARAAPCARGWCASRTAAPDATARCPPPSCRPPPSGPVQPFGVRMMIIGHSGRPVSPSSRAACWMAPI